MTALLYARIASDLGSRRFDRRADVGDRDPQRVGIVGGCIDSGACEEGREAGELVGEPAQGVIPKARGPLAVARLDAVEAGVEVRLGQVSGRAVDLVEEIGAEHRLIDRHALRS